MLFHSSLFIKFWILCQGARKINVEFRLFFFFLHFFIILALFPFLYCVQMCILLTQLTDVTAFETCTKLNSVCCTWKNNSDFYCLNVLHCFRTKNELELHVRVCENKEVCNVIMLSEDTKILEFNQYQKIWQSTIYYLCRSWMYNRKDWCM